LVGKQECPKAGAFHGFSDEDLPRLKPFGDHEVVRGAAVRLLNQLQRLDQRDLDILLLDQRRERLGGDFPEVPECELAFALGEGGGDLDGIRGFNGDDGEKFAIPCRRSGFPRQASGEPRPAELTGSQEMVYRSFMRVGWLTPEVSQQLKRQDEKDSTCGFWPDSLCISIDPFCPKCLGDDDELLCVGLVAVTFSGNGYFSWGVPWNDYAEQYRASAPVREAMRIAQSHFPVESTEIIPKIEAALGQRFLNRSYYVAGDWVLTPSESG
jgi:hypothetical protein